MEIVTQAPSTKLTIRALFCWDLFEPDAFSDRNHGSLRFPRCDLKLILVQVVPAEPHFELMFARCQIE